jgi:chorismate synthase
MNSFGTFFRVHIFGESHGAAVGICIDNCPAGIDLNEEDFLHDISRRKSGAKGTTPRQEEDTPEIISGVFNGKTTGAPITILFKNNNVISKDYSNLIDMPRPGHADFTAKIKYGGFNDYRGGGHFSGRLTLCLVAAGVIAKKICKTISVQASLIEAGGQTNIEKAIDDALAAKDSIGGIVECIAENMPIGLGEPFFDSLESKISHIVFAIPAIKGIEFGSGFSAAKMKGSEHNDTIADSNGKTDKNNAGGINGGISNGNSLVFRVAVKPTSSIGIPQETMNFKSGQKETLEIKGRHDACIALRVPVVIEAATAIVLADMLLMDDVIMRKGSHAD